MVSCNAAEPTNIHQDQAVILSYTTWSLWLQVPLAVNRNGGKKVQDTKLRITISNGLGTSTRRNLYAYLLPKNPKSYCNYGA